MIRENLLFIKKTFTWRRLGNAVITYLSYFLSLLLRKPLIWGFPDVVMIEPTNICNLKCPLCPSGNGTLQRSRGFMDLELFKKLIDQIKKKSTMVVLWNQGESFLHQDFLKMIDYASRAGLFTLVSTNANVELQPEELIRAGLDSMIVSLDGATQETYNKYRVNGKLDLVLQNTRKLVEAKKKMNSKKPLIRWQFLVLKHNEHELDEIKKMAVDYQVDNLEIKTAQIYRKEDIDAYLPRNHRYRRYQIKGDDFQLKVGIPNRCRRIWTTAVINWDGELAICCFDKDLQFPIGNIRDKKLKDLWRAEKFQEIRKKILKDRKQIEICRNCGESVKLRIKN
ncbi:MAG: SPASM domain-containing protein [Candidatus Cloacimonetes bacterium]|nr:SPASM domain-containing protein [Candidatus Cloacimonadota bacterium]